MKFPSRWKFNELKERLVLTREEKRVIVFVLAAFVLGLAAKHYRDLHPTPAAPVGKAHRALPSHRVSPSPLP